MYYGSGGKMNNVKRMKIGLKVRLILIISFLMTILFAVLIFTVVFESRRFISGREIDRISRETRPLAQIINLQISSLREQLYAYSNNFRIHNDLDLETGEKLGSGLLVNLEKSRPAIDSVFLPDADGIILYSGSGYSGANYSSSLMFRALKNEDELGNRNSRNIGSVALESQVYKID